MVLTHSPQISLLSQTPSKRSLTRVPPGSVAVFLEQFLEHFYFSRKVNISETPSKNELLLVLLSLRVKPY